MIPLHSFRQSELRERVTEAILEILQRLPDTQRSIYIWSHYRGCQPKQIAEMLGRSAGEVETALNAVNAMIYRKARSLLEEDSESEAVAVSPAAEGTNFSRACRFGCSPFDLRLEARA